LPSINLLDTEYLARILDKLMLCQVIREDGDIRFLIKFHGQQFEKAHGRRCIGRLVEDAVAPSLREKALIMYRQVAASGKPYFSSTPMREGDGPIVNYERLLLPFTKSGSMVEYICCIITMVTEENGFNFDVAMKGRPIPVTAYSRHRA
jgi:hypothetical protein